MHIILTFSSSFRLSLGALPHSTASYHTEFRFMIALLPLHYAGTFDPLYVIYYITWRRGWSVLFLIERSVSPI